MVTQVLNSKLGITSRVSVTAVLNLKLNKVSQIRHQAQKII